MGRLSPRVLGRRWGAVLHWELILVVKLVSCEQWLTLGLGGECHDKEQSHRTKDQEHLLPAKFTAGKSNNTQTLYGSGHITIIQY